MKETKLDNPVWEALNSQHIVFAQGTEQAKRYRAGVLPFIGCKDGGKGSILQLDPFTAAGESFYILGDELPALPAGWAIENELICLQMILRKDIVRAKDTSTAAVITKLEATDADEMYDLVNMVQPGYYYKDTRLVGNYFGIKHDGKLIAIAGERMRLNEFIEVSAVCTLPGYTGRGYAQQLMTKICNMHSESNVVSFLHVALSNQRAIGLYEHMGFEKRRTIVVRKVKKEK